MLRSCSRRGIWELNAPVDARVSARNVINAMRSGARTSILSHAIAVVDSSLGIDLWLVVSDV